MHHAPMAIRRILLVLILLATWPVASFGLADEPTKTLRVLAWPGYADPDVVAEFEKRHRAHIDLTLIASDEEMWKLINADNGRNFDVFAVNTAELQRYIRAKLVQPINTSAIANIQRQLPRFRKLAGIPGLVHDGKAYAIPYTYAEMGLIYDRKQFSTPPDSIAALWDPSLQGRVLAYNGGGHNFSLAAMAMGLRSPFRLSPSDWPKAVERLIALRRNVLGFYTFPDEATWMFRKHHVALLFANYGSQQVQALRAAGADIGYVIPKEGALAWLDCWAVSRGAHDLELVYDWIDFMLEPRISDLLVSRQGLANTLTEPPGSSVRDRRVWLEPMGDPELRDHYWSRIMSGDSARKVLAP